jgi:L-alanine-DL-glutamate epimerase-like enolase superfamily enzyme
LIITSVEVIVVSGPHPGLPDGERQKQVRPSSVYPEHESSRRQASGAMPESLESLYLRIGTDGDAEGFYGPIDFDAARPIIDSLGDVIMGEDALAVAINWDKLARSNRHARHGHLKMAISAIDNCLWDLRGKVFDAPVWQLLGGGGRDPIPAYASTLGTSLQPDAVVQRARQLQADGFWGQKWFFADGPADGAEGLTRSVELARLLRGTLGDDYPIMFDAFHGWDLAFARAWTERVRDYHPTWLEEPFGPDRLRTFVELHRSTGQALSAGEHLYDRAEVLAWLNESAIAVVQSDPEWCGGVTELSRICAVAETFGVPVIPHGHGLHAALHVVASQSPTTCPSIEYLIRLMPNRHHFEVDPPRPVHGAVALPTGPGFGIRLDDNKIASRRTLDRSAADD